MNYTDEEKKDYISHAMGKIRQEISDRLVKEHCGEETGKAARNRRRNYRKSAEYRTKYAEILNADESYQALSNGEIPQSHKQKCENWISARRAKAERKRREEEKEAQKKAHLQEMLMMHTKSVPLDEFMDHFLDEHEVEICDKAEKRVVDALTHGKVHLPTDHFSRRDDTLAPNDMDAFHRALDFLFREDYGAMLELEQFICDTTSLGAGDEVIFDYIYEKMPWLKDLSSIDDDIHDIVIEAVCERNLAMENAVAADFTRERVEKLILENETYRPLAEQVRLTAAVSSTILTRMPDRIIDLYPMARAIHRTFELHVGPTNSGKTHEAIKCLKSCTNGIYLGPLRLLAYEQYDRLNRDGVVCSLLTGEERQDMPGSTVVAATVEMADFGDHYDAAVIDEAQMIEDAERGGAWTAAILGLCADKIMVCCAPEAEKRITELITMCGDAFTTVRHERMVPLEIEDRVFEYPKDVKKGDALIVFSRRDVHAVAMELSERGIKCSIIYGALPYNVRHQQAEEFASGKTDVVVSTDAIGLGMNLPISRVIFLADKKYNGYEEVSLPRSLIRQIAGRAGRYGIYSEGFVAASSRHGLIELKKALNGKPAPVKDAVLSFPESLLGIDAPLSVLLSQWKSLAPDTGFRKSNIDREIQLTKELEQETDDKLLIYQFVTIPFSERDDKLHLVWKEMFLAEIRQNHFPTEKLLDALENDISSLVPVGLETLESDYRVCDLVYHYVEKFLPPADKEEDGGRAMRIKNTLSEKIMDQLGAVHLTRRTCRECGRPLPWNYPYGICSKCYSKSRHWRW